MLGLMEHIANAIKDRPPITTTHETSLRPPDGSIVEMVYDGAAERTQFALWRDGAVTHSAELTSGAQRTVPYSPRNTLVAHGIVLFPAQATEYGSERGLVEEVRAFIHRYVDLDPAFERIAAHYVLLTWIYDAFNELPYLRVRGDPGTGKTRFLLTIGHLAYKSTMVSGASSVSPVFRMLDTFRGTLVIDESDFRFSDERAEFVKILNNGNGRGFPVLRCEVSPSTKEFNPRAYAVFGPKIIATRGLFEDRALESRCITHDTKSAGLRSDVPLNLPATFADEARTLRNKLLMFRFRNLTKSRDLSLFVDSTLEPRLNQVFAPLMSLVDDETTRRDLTALLHGYQGQLVADRGLDIEAAVLEVVRNLAVPGKPSPSVRRITEAFLAQHSASYPRTTPRWIGHILRKKLGITTKKSDGAYVIAATEYGKLDALYEKYAVPAPPGESTRSLFDVPEVHEGYVAEALRHATK